LNPQQIGFPDPETALEEPNGLLAAGGDLTADWLLAAYAAGIFPWFNDDASAILWWSPDPRAVITPGSLKISRSLGKRLRSGQFTISMDQAFTEVLDGCAAPRRDTAETWITPRMGQGYLELHELGFAHSVEVWDNDDLVGGLYGLSLGRMFFGESMFSVRTDASKVALCYLVAQLRRWEFNLIDCQMMNPHLASLGAKELGRHNFLNLLAQNQAYRTRQGPWSIDEDLPADVASAAGSTRP
jgi:leucyl/phenylalanyl-tRNA--protein transferase